MIQTDPNAAETHVGEQLSLMDRMDRLNTLHFHDHQVLDYQIHTTSQLNPLALIDDRQADLRGNGESTSLEFMGQTGLIGTFQQSRSKFGMDLHRRGDYGAGYLIHANGWAANRRSHANRIPQISCVPL